MSESDTELILFTCSYLFFFGCSGISAHLTMITSSPMRSILSQGIQIVSLVFENTKSEPYGGSIIWVIFPLQGSSQTSQIYPKTLPSRAFITSFSRNLSNEIAISQKYAYESAAALVYYFLQRVGNFCPCIVGHMVKLCIKSFAYKVVKRFAEHIGLPYFFGVLLKFLE